MLWGSVAIWLRLLWATVIGVLAAATVLVVRAGVMSPGVALAADIGVLFVGIMCLVALGYAASRSRTFTPPAELATSAPRAVVAIFTEFLAILALYAAIEPFERWWMGRDAIGRLPAGRVPVLFVHAYLSNRGQWWWLRRGLRRCGVAVATVNLEPPLQSIDRFAEQLGQRIEQCLHETGAQRLCSGRAQHGWSVARMCNAMARPHRRTGHDRHATPWKLVCLCRPRECAARCTGGEWRGAMSSRSPSPF